MKDTIDSRWNINRTAFLHDIQMLTAIYAISSMKFFIGLTLFLHDPYNYLETFCLLCIPKSITNLS